MQELLNSQPFLRSSLCYKRNKNKVCVWKFDPDRYKPFGLLCLSQDQIENVFLARKHFLSGTSIWCMRVDTQKKLSNLFLEMGLVNAGDMLKLIQHLGVNLPASLVCDRSRSESCYFVVYLVSIVLLKPKSKVSWTTNLIQQEKAV